MFKTSLANIILRGLTLLSKFVLLVYIARYLTPADLGVFGLMAVTIAISLYILGFDFYVFNTREILACDPRLRCSLIRDQMVFHGLIYLVMLPLLLALFAGGLLQWQYVGWFYGLLVLEHISQESIRLLITLSRPTMASTVLLVRSGLWVYAVIGVATLSNNFRTIEFVWAMWIMGSLSSILLSAYALRDLDWRTAFDSAINWKWVKRGTRGALPFFGATVALLGVQYTDRYFLQSYHGEATVGIYTFYANIANMVHVFVYTAFIMTVFPKLVSAYQEGRFTEFQALYRSMNKKILVGTGVLVGLAALGIWPALILVGKEAYSEYLGVFWIMLGTISLLTVSYIPHYALYVRKEDRAIAISSVIALASGVAANMMLVPENGIIGAALATFCAMGVLSVCKFVWLGVVIRGEREYSHQKSATQSKITSDVPIKESVGA